MKFAIEVFGQLRLWEIQSSLPKLKSFLIENGFRLILMELFGTMIILLTYSITRSYHFSINLI
tara:strand:- start:221 stop:409 length:189 start_codon:yes stop_codon:yes gene_type:complete